MSRSSGVRVRPFGPTAALIELDSPGSAADAAVASWQAAVLDLVASGDLERPTDVVPGACTVLVDGVDPAAVARAVDSIGQPSAYDATSGSWVELPVSYDGADLAEVARLWGMSIPDVVAKHTATEFRVAFCGFAPGFAYLVGLDAEVPRRATPRTAVPAGSVGLAGRYCGIYPTSSPGGWQLLGRTDRQLFDAERDPPALLPPGTRVRFVEVPGHAEQAAVARPTVAGPLSASSPAPEKVATARSLTVVRPGALTTVQDAGRPGRAHLGVPRAGALDPGAARLANRLVGNDENAAVLETTLSGVAVRAGTATTVAVTGAPGPVQIGGRPAAWGAPVGVPPGALIDLGPAQRGVRAYLAVAGGIDVAPVLGSRSADTLSGLGPAPLAEGDLLPVGDPTGAPAPVDYSVAAWPDSIVLRLHQGPRADWFGRPGLTALLGGTYTLSPASNRVGARLSGPAVPRLREGELDSEGMVLGAVQVPPDGQPVVFLADHPTTGGYPVVGVVDPADLPLLAQARPGAAVRFTTSTRS